MRVCAFARVAHPSSTPLLYTRCDAQSSTATCGMMRQTLQLASRMMQQACKFRDTLRNDYEMQQDISYTGVTHANLRLPFARRQRGREATHGASSANFRRTETSSPTVSLSVRRSIESLHSHNYRLGRWQLAYDSECMRCMPVYAKYAKPARTRSDAPQRPSCPRK